jgi:hypothetical protein
VRIAAELHIWDHRVMADKPDQSKITEAGAEAVRDVLAAEEFPVGAPDPSLNSEPAHDVLAAEEFAVGSGDPELHHGPVELPEDPSGIQEPHDVLAAEEFALPAGPIDPGSRGGPSPGRLAAFGGVLVAAGAATFSVLRRRRRHSRLDRVRRLKP